VQSWSGHGKRPELPREHEAACDEEHEPGKEKEIRISFQRDAAARRAKGKAGEQSAQDDRRHAGACLDETDDPMMVIETPTIVAEVGRM